jgi:DNA recombination protein RmuC
MVGTGLAFALGLLAGLGVAWALRLRASRSESRLAAELQSAFGDISARALQGAITSLAEVTGERMRAERDLSAQELDGKKALIDQQVQQMSERLEKLAGWVRELEKDRESKFGRLEQELRRASETNSDLARSAASLKEVLASPRARGQWGERMAEDVLRAAGFVEGINYRRNLTQDGGTRPDFTLMVPRDRVVNMDAKFPLDNYQRYVAAASEVERGTLRDRFLRDVRARVREIGGREYIDPEHGTLDCVLLFIPNEQLYAFIQESDPDLLDEAMARKVVLCSPVTLFAVLAVLRQASESFSLEQASRELLSLMGQFRKQWVRFTETMDRVGNRLRLAGEAFEELQGTRRSQLERPLTQIDELRRLKSVPLPDDEDGIGLRLVSGGDAPN